MLCPTLSKVQRATVDFDPANPEHQVAYRMLVLGENGPTSPLRQHPTLRFNVDRPYDSVRDMMINKISEYFITHVAQT